MRVTADMAGLGSQDIGMSTPELYAYRERSGIFEDISGVYPIDANLTEVDEPERVEVVLVSPSYFSLLGAQPQLGRVFSNEEDDAPGNCGSRRAQRQPVEAPLRRPRRCDRPQAAHRQRLVRGRRRDAPRVRTPGTRAAMGHRHVGAGRAIARRRLRRSTNRAAAIRSAVRIARLKNGVTLADARERLEAFGVACAQNRLTTRSAPAGRRASSPLHDDVVGESRGRRSW